MKRNVFINNIHIKRAIYLLVTVTFFMLSACSYKVDKNENCLNPASNCYVPDVTAPEIAKVEIYKEQGSTPVLVGSTINQLYMVDITYSEVMRDADDEDNFTFIGGSGDANLSIDSITKVSDIRYQYIIGGLVGNGPISLKIDAVDVSRKFLQINGNYPLTLTGSVNLSVELLDVSSNYLTTNTINGNEHNLLTVQFQHDFAEDSQNFYWIMLNSTSCNFASKTSNLTEVDDGNGFSGSELVSKTPSTFTLKASSLTTGVNTVLVCVRNDNKNKEGYATIDLNRDDTLPLSRLADGSPGGGAYPSVQNIGLTCDDSNCASIAYTTDISDPSFSGTVISNGMQYTASWETPHDQATEPTSTTLRWRAVDRAGNVETLINSEEYTIDSRVPNVQITSVTSYYISNQSGAINATDINFSMKTLDGDQIENGKYIFITDGSACPLPGDAAYLPYDTPLTTTGTENFADTSSESQKNMKICVGANFSSIDYVGSRSVNINVDNTLPTFAGITSATPRSNDTDLKWIAATDDSPVIYEIFEANTSAEVDTLITNNTPTTTSTVLGEACTINDITKVITCTLTGRDPDNIYFYGVRAKDGAGNKETDTGLIPKIPSGYQIQVTANGMGSAVTLTLNESINKNFSNGDTDISIPKVLHDGDTYSVSIGVAPVGQVCAIEELQFGTISGSNITMNLKCVDGYMVGGRFQTPKPVSLNYHLYRGKANAIYSGSGMSSPVGMAMDSADNFYTATIGDHTIRKLSGGNFDTVFAGQSGTSGSADGTGISASFNYPRGLVSDGTNLYFTEFSDSGRVGKIDSSGKVTTLANLDHPLGEIAYYSDAGNNSYLFIANRTTIRGVSRLNLATGDVEPSFATGSCTDAEGVVVVDSTLYVSCVTSNQIMSAPVTGGILSLYAGTGEEDFQDGNRLSAKFSYPAGMTTDGRNLYVVDYSGHRVRRIDTKSGMVSTIAGSGNSIDPVLNAIGVSAQIANVQSVTTDGRALYVSISGTVGDETTSKIIKMTDNGLVGYWPLNGTSMDYNSDGVAVNNGSCTICPTLEENGDRFGTGKAYHFDGSNQYITASPDSLPYGNSERSICGWIKVDSTPDTDKYKIIVGYGGINNGEGNGLGLWNDGGTVKLVYFGLANDLAVPFYFTDHWLHVCGTYNGTNAKLYANGHLLGSEDLAWNTVSNKDLHIGKQMHLDEYFSGFIADVRIYDRVLNESEINELAQDSTPDLVGESYNRAATGLLSHYRFDNGTDLQDNGSLDYDLTDQGATTASYGKDGDSDGAKEFDGTNQYLATNDITTEGIGSGQNMTIMAWIKLNSLPATGQNMAILARRDSGPGGFFFSYRESSGYKFYWTPSVGTVDYQPLYTLPVKTWSHVAVVQNGSLTSIYVNGKFLGSKTTSNFNSDSSSTPLNIGAKAGAVNPFNGTIDDVRIYNNALTSDQIRQLASQIPAGLVVRYDFIDNGKTDDAFKDVSGFGQHLKNDTDHSNNPIPTHHRFDTTAGTAMNFDGTTQYLITQTPAAFLPTGAAPRTMCAWYLDTTGDSNDEILSYGDSSNAGLSGMYVSGKHPGLHGNDSDLGSGYLGNMNVWNFVCTIYDDANSKVYVNGAEVATGSPSGGVWNTPTGTILYIGAIDPLLGDWYFHGKIDEVTIYNRALTVEEIRAMTNQPNKRIRVSTTSTMGDMSGGSGGTGISGADWICQDNFGPTYKAMIVDEDGCGVSTPCRRACITENCTGGIIEHINWVLRPGVTYLNINDEVVFTAGWNGVFAFGNFSHSIYSGVYPWTGFSNIHWVTEVNSTCNSWNSTGDYGMRGTAAGYAYNSLSLSSSVCSHNDYFLYCVEQ